MKEELGKLYEKLSLTEQEQEEIQVETSLLEDVISKGSKCLIIKLLMDRHYKKEVFKQTMKKIWRPVKSIKFRDLGSVLTLVEFEDIQDKDRVQREGIGLLTNNWCW